MLPQDPDAGRVEGADPEPVERHIDQPLDPFPHLACCLVRKGHRKNVARVHVSLADQVRDPAGDHPRFPAARSGQDQKRPVAVQDGFALRRI